MKINFLHLSDLHISEDNLNDIEIVLNSLWEDLKNLDLEIDYIFFTGDLVNTGEVYEYLLAEEVFINPLLEVTELEKDKIFFVPGNHDINRSKIDEFVDKNLSSKFNCRDEINKFIDNMKKRKKLFKRLDDYNSFINDLMHDENNHLENSNVLHSDYRINHGEINIGVACLNSAWCSYGGEKDYGNLLIGERQIDNAINSLSECDLKIALFHHPREWLKGFDQKDILDRILEFDFILNGHNHSSNPKEIIYSNYTTIVNKCGALYQGREYNGYSIISYDYSLKEVQVYLREYFDRKRSFDKAISIVDEGRVRFSLSDEKNLKIYKKNLEIIQSIKKDIYNDINRKLITSISHDTSAPKKIDEIYVKPFLSKKAESCTRAEKEITKDLENILENNKNILFVGKKEIGKTTLLDYICYYMYECESYKIILPFIINFKELPNGKKVFQKAMNNYLLEYGIKNFNIEENLNLGNCVLLIDDFNLDNKKNINKLKEFSETYPENRFILTTNEDMLQTIEISDIPDIGFDYSTYYIYTLRRNQVRELVDNWFSQSLTNKVENEMILNKVMSSLKETGVPKTPLVISLFLWIVERERNYSPINEASLIEKFIELLLEKLDFNDARYKAIDYRIKSDFLAYISSIMVKNDTNYLSEKCFDNKIDVYFDEKGLEIDKNKFKKIFFDKGILVFNNKNIYFRYRCFLEFFTSKYMMENEDFSDFILKKENYLNYINEIVYLTGLERKSSDILELIEHRLKSSFEEIDDLININELVNLPINEFLSNKLKETNIKDTLKNMKLDDKEKDKLLEDNSSANENNEMLTINNKSKIEKEFIFNLDIYSKILRNCELIKKEEKESALSIAINKYCKLTGLLYIIYHEISQDLKNDNEEIEEFDDIIDYTFRVSIPLVMQNRIANNLGSPKLKVIIEDHIEKVETDFEKFMLICLYGDMRLKGYINKFSSFLNNTKSRFIKEIAIAKLFYYNSFFKKSKREEEELINLITELVVERNKNNKEHMIHTNKRKNALRNKLKKDALINNKKED